MSGIDWDLPYSSRRSPVLARNVVATSQPLAVQAGLEMLRQGGNAVDAALAAAVCLTVVEPTSNGLGSDAFAIVWDGKGLHGLNASGRSPSGWTPERFAGRDAMPVHGWDAVTVPGAVSGWIALSERFGRLAFERLFEPALRYAREGFFVSPRIAASWRRQATVLRRVPGFADAFLPGGRAPKPGERFVLPGQAESLEQIAGSRGGVFYSGPLAERMVDCSRAAGGAMTLDDLAAHRAQWVEPLSLDYRGVTVHELPPNGQGIAALEALGILRDLGGPEPACDSADRIHRQVEAMRIALADAYRHVADPAAMRIAPGDLLASDYLRRQAAAIDPKRAADAGMQSETRGGTVYLATADASGMMVSFIQSNFMGFGSGVVVPGTGVSLNNRGAGFTLDEDRPNRVGPDKLPFHTIIPGFVTRDGTALMAFGVMGGSMQAQGHLQVLDRMLVHGQNPQAAIDAPRWRLDEEWGLCLEPGLTSLATELESRGHRVRLDAPAFEFGGAQAVMQLGECWCAGSDPRKDGQAAGF